MTRRLMRILCMGVAVLAVASLATAQQVPQVPQPVVRLGNFLEVGNDVWMHIIASIDTRYITVENRDFEQNVRDRPNSRFPDDTAAQRTDADAALFQNRIGVEARYQKNLEFYLLFEHRAIVDGNLIDDRANSTNPGGTDVFGRAPATENSGFHTERSGSATSSPAPPLSCTSGRTCGTSIRPGWWVMTTRALPSLGTLATST